MIAYNDLVVGFLILTRVSTFITFFPLFAKRQLPRFVKVGLAVALSLFWYEQLNTNSDLLTSVITHSSVYASLLICKEVVLGFLLAFTAGLFFWPAKIAGSYLGAELGLSMAAISDPSSQDSSSIIATIFEAFIVLLFFGMNLHHFVILVLNESFTTFATDELIELPTEQLVSAATQLEVDGLIMAAPMVVLFGGVSLIVAMVTRAAPAFNLFTVGMPVRLGLGLVGLFIFSGAFCDASAEYLVRAKHQVVQVVGFLFQ